MYQPYIRFEESKKLYEIAYENYAMNEVLSKGNIISTVEVKNTTEGTVDLNLLVEDTVLGISSSLDLQNIEYTIVLDENIVAPIAENQVLGTISCVIDNITYESNLVAEKALEESKFFTYALLSIFLLIIIIAIIYLVKSSYNDTYNSNSNYKKSKSKNRTSKKIGRRKKDLNIYKNRNK